MEECEHGAVINSTPCWHGICYIMAGTILSSCSYPSQPMREEPDKITVFLLADAYVMVIIFL